MPLRTLLVIASMLTLSTPASAAEEIIDIPFTRYTLDNGLTLIVHEDHKAPLVAVPPPWGGAASNAAGERRVLTRGEGKGRGGGGEGRGGEGRGDARTNRRFVDAHLGAISFHTSQLG